MANGDIQFDEDQHYYAKTERHVEIPKKGIEGWFYNKMPGKYSYKKNLLILVIIGVFVLAFIFFVLGIQNLGEIEDNNFSDRVSNTQSR